MKIVLLGDTHFGVREDKESFHSYFAKFYRECLFPEMHKRGIKHIIQLGDLFDRRKYINFTTLKRSKQYFFDLLRENGIFMHALVGNHDIALRNTLEINSLELLLSEYSNIEPITTPREIELGTKKFLMLPWICSGNLTESNNLLDNSTADYCCGHLEISGFQMYRGTVAHEGIDPKIFRRFDAVFSGHYHHRSIVGNIRYVGAPCEHTHMDQGDIRGFDILDTDTGKIEFVQNPFTMFEKFIYSDTDISSIDFSRFEEKYVKVVIQKKTDFYKFDNFIQRLYNSKAHDIKIMDTITEMTAEEMDETVNIEDTQTILSHFIDNAEIEIEKSQLKKYMNQLYIEALHTAST